ncbi:MAG: type II secretion system F family protein [Bacillota bacterium]|nr:type II secretion system F family protein [Bacillota bacterium]
MLWLIVVSAAATTTVVMLFLLSLPADTRKVRDRLRRFVDQQGITPAEAALLEEARRRGQTEKSPARHLLRLVSRSLDSQAGAKKLQVQLERADILLKGSEFLVINALVAAALGIAGLAVTRGNPMAAAGGLLAGWILPRLQLQQRIAKRQKAFNAQLAEALTVMSNSLKAGYSFLQAMEMVSREMLPPISVEFGRALREVSLGVATESALEAMVRRIGSDDLDLVVTCVLIQRQVGGNLAEILDNISHTIRERIRIKGEIKTLTAQGRMSGLIISLLPFALAGLMFVLSPKYIGQLLANPLGRGMLAMGLVSEGIGIFFIRKITNVEV